MASQVAQYCINVTDLDRSAEFYTALGLTELSRTEIDQASEALVGHPTYARTGKLQLAQQKEPADPFDLGTAFWKLYVNTADIEDTFRKAQDAGATVVMKPMRMDRWPVSVAFVTDPDGYTVELVERHPWPDDAPTTAPWLGQYCINVTDIDSTIRFYETLGLACTSRTEIDQAFEAVLESPDEVGGKVQLAQQKEPEPVRMGSLWKLYVDTDDAVGLHDAAVAAGFRSTMAPLHLERWDTTIAFVADPDDYQVELVQRHNR